MAFHVLARAGTRQMQKKRDQEQSMPASSKTVSLFSLASPGAGVIEV